MKLSRTQHMKHLRDLLLFPQGQPLYLLSLMKTEQHPTVCKVFGTSMFAIGGIRVWAYLDWSRRYRNWTLIWRKGENICEIYVLYVFCNKVKMLLAWNMVSWSIYLKFKFLWCRLATISIHVWTSTTFGGYARIIFGIGVKRRLRYSPPHCKTRTWKLQSAPRASYH